MTSFTTRETLDSDNNGIVNDSIMPRLSIDFSCSTVFRVVHQYSPVPSTISGQSSSTGSTKLSFRHGRTLQLG